jgi:AraC-like DNA-binding protein
MNGIIFSNQLSFNVYEWSKYRYTDNRAGAHPYYIAMMIEGTGKLVSKDTTLTVCAGDVFYIPSGYPYQSYWYGEESINFISLAFSAMPDQQNGYTRLQAVDCDNGIRELFYEIAKRDMIDCKTVGLFYCLLDRILPKLQEAHASRQEGLVEAAKRIITQDPFLSVSDLAKRLAVSESALYLAFRRCSRTHIGEYRTECILERAKQMLISTDATIESISSALDFSSGSYFRKCFKKAYGITPRAFRQKRQI